MGSIFGPFVNIEEKPFVWDGFSEEIMQYAMDNVARDMQYRLRARLDTGVDLKAATVARTVTVRNEMGELIIKAADDKTTRENTTIDDLFKVTQTTPSIEANRLIFKRIQEEQVSSRNTAAVKRSVEETVTLNFKTHIEDGIKKVISENPKLR